MDVETLRHTLEQASLASLATGFMAGFIFSFNPVALAAIPVALAYVTKAHETRRAVLFGAMFLLGMLVTHACLGWIAGYGGQWTQKLLGREWGLLLGPLAHCFGFDVAGLDSYFLACHQRAGKARHQCLGCVPAGRSVFRGHMSSVHAGFGYFAGCGDRYRFALVWYGAVVGLCLRARATDYSRRLGNRMAGGVATP